MRPKHQIKRKALTTAITTAIISSAQISLALAQDQASDAEAGILEEVIVTATRREASIQDIPYNISAVSGDWIESSQIFTNNELMRAVPGASVVDRGHRNSGVINSIMIRGLNVESNALGDYALSTVPTVSTYINDTPIFANFIIKDVERVEVLRGPQGTLYGSGSLAGTVKFLTRRPVLGEFAGTADFRVSTTDGSDGNNWSVDAMLNFPLGDSFAVRVLAGKIDNDGIVDLRNAYVLDSNGIPVAPEGYTSPAAEYEYLEDADTVEIEYARVSMLFEPNDMFSAVFTFQTQSDDIGGRRHVTVESDGWGNPYDDYQIGSVQREPATRDVDLASLEMDFDLGFATLTSSTSTYTHEGDSTSENTGFYAQLNWLAWYYYNSQRPMAAAVRTYDDEAFVQEVRLVSNGDGKVDWIAGAFYQDLDQIATQMSWLHGWSNWADAAWGDCSCVDDNDFRYHRDENFKEKALFGELTYHFSDRFRMTGGARYFDNKYKNDTFIGVGLWTEGIFRTADYVSFSGGESDTLFKFNFSYDLKDNMMFYGTYSEGFRRGGANAVPLSGIWANDEVWQRYDPDSVKNYELGLKGSSDKIKYTAALFYIDWKDIQLNDASTAGSFFAAINGGDASTKGFELEISGYSDNNFDWNLGYAYVDGQLDSDLYKPDDFDFSDPIAFKGDRLPGTAKHTANVNINHYWQMNNGMSVISRLGGYYQSSTENHINRSETYAQKMSGFSLWDVSSGIYSDNWNVTLFVKNLFNEEGVTGVFKEEYMGTSPEQNYYGNGSKQFISMPRTIGVSFGISF